MYILSKMEENYRSHIYLSLYLNICLKFRPQDTTFMLFILNLEIYVLKINISLILMCRLLLLVPNCKGCLIIFSNCPLSCFFSFFYIPFSTILLFRKLFPILVKRLSYCCRLKEYLFPYTFLSLYLKHSFSIIRTCLY